MYYSNGLTRVCNGLVRIIRHLCKVQVLYYATQLLTQLFTQGINENSLRMPCLEASRVLLQGECQQLLALQLTLRITGVYDTHTRVVYSLQMKIELEMIL